MGSAVNRLPTCFGAAALFGSVWPQAVPAQTPGAPTLELVFTEKVMLGADVIPGPTPYGRRNIVPITGGTFEGPEIHGTILPGGWDWQLGRSDACLDINADYMLRTDDGVVINILNKGVACAPQAGRAFSGRTHPVFEAPIGKYDWLNKSTFVGTLDPGSKTADSPYVTIRIYRLK